MLPGQKSIMCVLAAAAMASCSNPPETEHPIDISVLVLNFDPLIPGQEPARLHEVLGWNDPRQLAESYRRTIDSVSQGRVVFHIAEWKDLDSYLVKTDGFVYTSETFMACWTDRSTCHDPDGIDYAAMVEAYGVLERIDSGEIDELWIFGAPYFGFWESSMAGPGAFYINGGVYPEIETESPFVIMGFSYERKLAEMLHNLCHRAEATMELVYGGWKVDDLSTSWARFAANAHQSGGLSAVGTCHYPPNGVEDYDYDNAGVVWSSARGWLDYPNSIGAADSVSRDTWGGPAYHENYLKWWFSHLPNKPGLADDGYLADWWQYIFGFRTTISIP